MSSSGPPEGDGLEGTRGEPTERIAPPAGDVVARALLGLREHEVTRRDSALPSRYELEQPLGRGGMAVVWRARDRQLERHVAVKFLRDDVDLGSDAAERFRREAEATARLAHPGVVQVHDAGDGWLVMELVRGRTLAARLAEERLDPREAARLLEKIARAVHAAHEVGVVHRDLKPHNVLLTAEGEPKVADFGLAHLGPDATALTASGDVFGTPAYMAPEQATGDRAAIGPRTDVYALGAIVYECVCGKPPFEGETALEVLRRVVDTDPVPLARRVPGAPAELAAIAGRAMEKRPADRYPSAEALADDLAHWLAGEPIVARPPGWLARLRRWARRRRVLLAIVGAALAALFVAMAVLLPHLARARRTQALWRDVAVLLSDGESHRRAGETARAAELFAAAAERCREDLARGPLAEAHYLLGRALARRGDSDAARLELERALAADPGLGEASFELGLLDAAAYDSQALPIYLAHYAGRPPVAGALAGPSGAELERRHPALAALRTRALERLAAPVGQSPFYRPAEADFGRAELARLRWEWDAARQGYERTLAAESLFVAAHVGLARLELFRTDAAAAEAHATRAIARDAGYAPAYLVRAEARWQRLYASGPPTPGSETEAALAAAHEDALRARALPGVDPALAEMALGHVLLLQGKLDLAVAAFDRSLERLPDNAVALNSRGYAHGKLDRTARARADFDAAIRLAPTYAQALLNRAKLRAGDDAAGARRDAEQALEWAWPEGRLRAQVEAFLAVLPP